MSSFARDRSNGLPLALWSYPSDDHRRKNLLPSISKLLRGHQLDDDEMEQLIDSPSISSHIGNQKDPRAGTGRAQLRKHATDLLRALIANRSKPHRASRPIIFIAHSLGGIVCREAMLQSRNEAKFRTMFNCVNGIVFISNPRKGAWMADWARILALASGLIAPVNMLLLNILRTNNPVLKEIDKGFCYWEELVSLFGIVVPQESATCDGRDWIKFHANHINMVKFISANDEGFKKIAEY